MVVDQSSSPLGAAVGHDATLPSDLIAAKPPVFSYSGLTRVVTSDATSAEPMLAPLAEFPHATTLPSFFTAAIADLVLKISLTPACQGGSRGAEVASKGGMSPGHHAPISFDCSEGIATPVDGIDARQAGDPA